MIVLQLNDTHKGFTENTDKIHKKFFKEIKQLEFDVLIHCGDMIAAQQKNVEKTFIQLRDAAGDKPVAVVRGNHDYWQNLKSRSPKHGWMSMQEILSSHTELAKKYNIILLDEGETIETDKVFIGGFTTWYHAIKPDTNDFHWMDYFFDDMRTVSEVLIKKQDDQLSDLGNKLVANTGKIRVVVSHMPVFGNDFDQRYTASYSCQDVLRWECEYYLFGHSHKQHVGSDCFGDTLAYQTGSHYDKPKYLLINLLDEGNYANRNRGE
jgi:predicted MPP superfamily phosphohydrolase